MRSDESAAVAPRRSATHPAQNYVETSTKYFSKYKGGLAFSKASKKERAKLADAYRIDSNSAFERVEEMFFAQIQDSILEAVWEETTIVPRQYQSLCAAAAYSALKLTFYPATLAWDAYAFMTKNVAAGDLCGRCVCGALAALFFMPLTAMYYLPSVAIVLHYAVLGGDGLISHVELFIPLLIIFIFYVCPQQEPKLNVLGFGHVDEKAKTRRRGLV